MIIKEAVILIGATVLTLYPFTPPPKPKPLVGPWGQLAEDGLKTPEAVKALYPAAEDWIETEHDGRKFIICANHLPSFGVSRIDIHGWVFRTHSNRWERMFLVRLTCGVNIKLSVDPKSGQFRVTGAANNHFNGKTVFMYDLNATEL